MHSRVIAHHYPVHRGHDAQSQERCYIKEATCGKPNVRSVGFADADASLFGLSQGPVDTSQHIWKHFCHVAHDDLETRMTVKYSGQPQPQEVQTCIAVPTPA